MASLNDSASDMYSDIDYTTSAANQYISGNEELEFYQNRLEKLKKDCFEKSLESTLLKRSSNHINVSKVLNTVFSSDEKSKSFPDEQKRYIKQLLHENEELNKAAYEISKENRKLEKQIIIKKIHLKDCTLKRRKLWNEAAKILTFASGNLSEYENMDASGELSDISDSNQQSKESQLKILNNGIASKAHRIMELSRILHNLISFSSMSWASNKDLLEILLCTGKILERKFDIKDQKEFKKIVDDTTDRLNHVQI